MPPQYAWELAFGMEVPQKPGCWESFRLLGHYKWLLAFVVVLFAAGTTLMSVSHLDDDANFEHNLFAMGVVVLATSVVVSYLAIVYTLGKAIDSVYGQSTAYFNLPGRAAKVEAEDKAYLNREAHHVARNVALVMVMLGVGVALLIHGQTVSYWLAGLIMAVALFVLITWVLDSGERFVTGMAVHHLRMNRNRLQEMHHAYKAYELQRRRDEENRRLADMQLREATARHEKLKAAERAPYRYRESPMLALTHVTPTSVDVPESDNEDDGSAGEVEPSSYARDPYPSELLDLPRSKRADIVDPRTKEQELYNEAVRRS